MARFNTPITQMSNDDGTGIASGWKLNFYSTGTSTRKDTFSDSALTSANANPVVADSSGRFGNIFLESGTYKVVLTDASDVEKWSADPVDGSLGASGAFTGTKTGAYTVTVSDATKIIPVNTTSAAITITLLPVATATNGFEITIYKTNAGANAVTIDADGSELIDGVATLNLTEQYESATLRASTTGWKIIARHRPNTASLLLLGQVFA